MGNIGVRATIMRKKMLLLQDCQNLSLDIFSRYFLMRIFVDILILVNSLLYPRLDLRIKLFGDL